MIDHREEYRYATLEQIIQATGCSTATARRWKASPETMPEMARRLIAYQNCHDLASIWGPDWEHFQYHSGKLFAPGWRNGFAPNEISAMFFRVQLVRVVDAPGQAGTYVVLPCAAGASTRVERATVGT